MKPLLAVNLGSQGKLSQVLNTIFTPITQESLPNEDGLLTIKEINQIYFDIGGLTAKKFWVIGSPIQHSRSPNLHNAAYKALNLPFTFDRFESTDADQVYKELINKPDFGGLAITMPLKLDIMKYATELSDAAQKLVLLTLWFH